MIRSAIIDPTGTYRYRLDRTWAPLLMRRCVFVMLNPSTADGSFDDPTIRRCISFAMKWGYGSLTVVNLFAFRATYPAQLDAADDPVGPENDKHIIEATARMHPDEQIVIAWGAQGGKLPSRRARKHFHGRVEEFLSLLRDRNVVRLGLTKDGHPRHPLYVPVDAALVSF